MALIVGVCRVDIGIAGNESLKGKRSVVRRVIDRARNRFNIAIAEVDDLDALEHGVLGFAVVGNDRRVLQSRIDTVVEFIEAMGLAPVEDHQFEIVNY